MFLVSAPDLLCLLRAGRVSDRTPWKMNSGLWLAGGFRKPDESAVLAGFSGFVPFGLGAVGGASCLN